MGFAGTLWRFSERFEAGLKHAEKSVDLDSPMLAMAALLFGENSTHQLRVLVCEPGQKRPDDLAGLGARQTGGVDAHEIRACLQHGRDHAERLDVLRSKRHRGSV